MKRRQLLAATLVTTVGDGVFVTCSTLYLTRILGFGPLELSVVLFCVGGSGALGGVVLGKVADRIGIGFVGAGSLVLAGVLLALLVLVQGFVAIAVTATAFSFFDFAGYSLRQAMIPQLFETGDVVPMRARVHMVTNIGGIIGAGIGSVALAVDGRQAYQAALLADAASFLACALIVARLSAHVTRIAAGDRAAPGNRAKLVSVLRDRPFVVLTFATGLIKFEGIVFEVILPLWIVQETHAPRWTYGVAVAVNTLSVIALQIWASSKVSTLDDAGRFYRYVGFALFFMCLFIELAAYPSAPVVALAVIMLAMFMQVTGEILRGSCEWVLSFGLAPAAQHGEYQGFFNGGTAMARTVGPPVLIAVVFGLTGGAWLVLGLAFLVVGFTIRGIVGWAGDPAGESV